MEIGETLYVVDRKDWREWLNQNHQTATEIWLVFYNKKSGKPRIAYSDAVEEALCFGWIDSIVKKTDPDYTFQRFSPRRKDSQLSELNRHRVKKMIAEGKMTNAGLLRLKNHLHLKDGEIIEHTPFTMPEDITEKLKEDPLVWKHFNNFPEPYRQIRIAYIDHSRIRPQEFAKRLDYFIKMTRLNKMFGSKV